jgi:hypothetical protein
MFIQRITMIIVSAALTGLAACGGGGSDAPNQPAAPPAPPPAATASLPITAANAQEIAEIVLDAATATPEIISVVDVVGIPFAGTANLGPANARAAGLFAGTTACDTGEVTTTWNDMDNSVTLSTGDSFDILFAMCFFAAPGATLDGGSSLSNMVITGDPFVQVAPWSFETTFGFDNLSATDSVDTVIIDGNLDLALSSIDNVVVESSIATNSLTVQHSGDSETLSEFVMAETIDLNTQTQIVSASGIFTSTELEGSVTFETLQDFLVIGDDNPSEGQFMISDSRSSVLLTVLDNMNVQLDIDVDLDGTIDETIVVSWSQLDDE